MTVITTAQSGGATGSSSRRNKEVVEPQVIDLNSLRDGVEEPDSVVEPLDFPKVTKLRLSYKNIAEINNLNNFDSLKVLRLDNNVIEKIESLPTNLTWLDLSFNNIREMSGLESLTKLEDLSLYHNHIEEIKGLDSCKKLNVLSLGRNRIGDLKQVNYLRKFQNLRCICLEGNKICSSDSYQQHVLAYLSNLKYLDYMLIDKKQVAQVQESYQLDELTELKEQEAEASQKSKVDAEKKVVEERLKLAFLDVTMNLYEELFQDEPEHITCLMCYTGLREEYKEKVTDSLKSLYVTVQERNDDRLKKIMVFNRAIKEAEHEAEADGHDLIAKFDSKKKKVFIKASPSNTEETLDMLQSLEDSLQQQEKQLSEVEIELQERLEQSIDDFEVQMSDTIKYISERGSEFFRALEDFEKQFNVHMVEGANSELESFAAQQAASYSAEDQKRQKYFSNREEMFQVIANFNEAHIYVIQSKDDHMQNQMNGWMTSFFNEKRTSQYTRNRNKIMEIKNLVDQRTTEITAFRDQFVGNANAELDEYDHDD